MAACGVLGSIFTNDFVQSYLKFSFLHVDVAIMARVTL